MTTTRRAGFAVTAGFLLLGVGGCVEAPAGAPVSAYGDVVEMVEVDGVRCIIASGYRSTAISCDWTTPR